MIIGLSGPAGSGKSTAAQYLIENHGFVLVKFAAPLKSMLRAIGLTDDELEGGLKEVPSGKLQGKTPRWAMQSLGTEWGRECMGESFWVNLWAERAMSNDRVVCDDCRFPNEAETIWRYKGVIVELVGRGGIAGNHVSESGIRGDFTFDNSKGVKKLHDTLDNLVKTL